MWWRATKGSCSLQIQRPRGDRWRWRGVERFEDGGGGFVVILLAAFGIGCSSAGCDEVFEFFLLRVVLGREVVVGGFPFFEVVE